MTHATAVTVAAMTVIAQGVRAGQATLDGHTDTMRAETQRKYASVNGMQMYYEIHGRAGRGNHPLVLIHGGGSTIESTFGRVLPELAQTRQVIAVELQAHGHTKDIARPLSFEQDADDVAALLDQLHVATADIIGFSNGGLSALQIAIRHPQLVNRLVLASTPYKRSGMRAGFFEGLQRATLKDMPQPLQDAYFKADSDPKGLQAMFDKDRVRMLGFRDFRDSDIHAIQAPALVLDGDQDVVLPEHALGLFHLLAHAQLAILPGGHGEYLGEICARNPHSKVPALAVAVIEEFLDSATL